MNILLVLLCSYFVLCQPPIPPYVLGDGLKLGDPSKAIIVFEHILDLACPGCQEFYLDIMPDLYSFYFNSSLSSSRKHIIGGGESGPGDLYIKVHFLSLPYHIASYLLTKSSVVLEKKILKGNRENEFTWFDWIMNLYKNQEYIENDAVKGLDQLGIIDVIYEKFFKTMGVSMTQQEFEKLMTTDEEMENLARFKFKFVTYRGSYGTPTFWINGVIVEEQSTFAEWKTLFDNLKKEILE